MGKVAELAQDKLDENDTPPLKLNIGGGDPEDENYVERKGYELVDRSVGKEAYPLDYKDGSAAEVYASHVLEHFPRSLVLEALKEWHRVLEPGGRIYIAVPDFDYLVNNYKSGGMTTNIQPYLFGGQTGPDDIHYCAFNRETLTTLLYGAGFENIRPFPSESTDCSQIDCSLNLMATKPLSDERTLSSVGGVLAAPRFGPTMHFRCQQTLSALSIPIEIIEGCFWWQQLSEGMEKHLEQGIEFVLTMDYDSVFTEHQVLELYRLLKAYPEFDALCALQSKRGGAKVLLAELPESIGETGEDVFDMPVTRILTGHFGLTMFRGDALREQPRPWMNPLPNKEGRWANENIDADISFWMHWLEQERKLGVASHVAIGHIQEMVTWPDENFEPIHQHMQDYADNGMPANVRH